MGVNDDLKKKFCLKKLLRRNLTKKDTIEETDEYRRPVLIIAILNERYKINIDKFKFLGK